MSQPTSIEWVLEVAKQNGYAGGGMTWNPIKGCSRVSPGCQHCYAERIAGRFSDRGPDGAIHDKPLAFEGFAIMKNGEGHWTGRVELLPDKLLEPFHRKKPTVYFISMSDLFHEKLSDEDIDEVFAVMALTQQHLYLILTKRAERMHKFFSDEFRDAFTEGATQSLYADLHNGVDPSLWLAVHHPLTNVWLGVSAEMQPYADEREEHLRRTPATKRFISYEPALGPIRHNLSGIDWLIYGDESGPGARPAELDWFRSARDQCVAAGVPFFGKQIAVNGRKQSLPELDGQQWTQVPIIGGRHI